MKLTTNLMSARLHQARGSAKETWGKASGRNRIRLEGQMERLSGRTQERLLRTEVQARREIEHAAQRGQQNIKQLSASLAATVNQALERSAHRRSSRIWIPALGGVALLAGLAALSYKTGLIAVEHTPGSRRLGF